MKKIIINTILVSAVLLSSCTKSFFEFDPSGSVDSGKAFETVKDVENALNGAYNALGSWRFLGRNVIATGDMAADNAIADASTGHFVNVNNYNIDEQNADMEAIWSYGYKVVDRTARLIDGANKLMLSATDSEKVQLEAILAQAHGLRALANFYMVNVFGFTYQQSPSTPGLVLVDKGLSVGDEINRSNISETYLFIEKDLDESARLFTSSDAKLGGLYFNKGAMYALQARVAIFRGEFDAVITAVDNLKSEQYSLVYY